MGSADQYSMLLYLRNDGETRQHSQPHLKDYLAEYHIDRITADPFPDILLQKSLFAILQDPHALPEHRILAEQCLRCRLSHQIFYTANALYQRYRYSQHHFPLIDLLSLVLNDTDVKLKPFTPIDPTQPKKFHPLAQKILVAYSPEVASLNTWAARLTKHDSEVVKFLLGYGIALISDWGLLNEAPTSRLERLLLTEYGIEGADATRSRYNADFQLIDYAINLLENFHIVYTQTRTPGSPCQEPTQEQLQEIANLLTKQYPGSQNLEHLKQSILEIAQLLRRHYILSRGGKIPQQEYSYGDSVQLENIIYNLNQGTDEFENPLGIDPYFFITDPIDDEELNDRQKLGKALLKTHQNSFPDALESAVAQAIEHRHQELMTSHHASTRAKADKYPVALYYFFSQFKTMSQIASLLGFTGQYNVTNLMKLNNMSKLVRRLTLQKMLSELREVTHAFPLQTLEDLDCAIVQIDKWIAMSEVDDDSSETDDGSSDTALGIIAGPIDILLKGEKQRRMDSGSAKKHNRFTLAVCKYLAVKNITGGE